MEISHLRGMMCEKGRDDFIPISKMYKTYINKISREEIYLTRGGYKGGIKIEK